MKNLITSLIGLAAIMAFPPSVDAASTRQYDAVPGIYNHQVTDIHRHSNGMIWIGTATGLCRYDGYNVISAPVVNPDSTIVVSDHIQEICEDASGRLWLKTQGQYGIYDPFTYRETVGIDKVLKEAGVPDLQITDIEADKDGNIWVALAGGGIYRIDGGTGAAHKTAYKTNQDFNVTSIVFNRFGIAVCVDESGKLSWIDPITLKVTEEALPPYEFSVNRKETYELAVDLNNRYWIYAPGSILEVFDGNKEKWVSDILPANEKHGNIKQIFQDEKGYLLIARDNHGVEKIVQLGDHLHIATADTPSDITYKNTITRFMNDGSATKWIGTHKKGLLTMSDCVRKFDLEKLPDVNCMIAGHGNTVWVGTDSSGLWKWDTATGEKSPVPDPAEGDSPAAITSLVMTPDGTLYVGSFAYGLRRVRDGKFEHLSTGSVLDKSFAWSLAPDGQGGIWVSTLGAGVFHYNPTTGQTRHYSDTSTYTPGLYVTSGIMSSDGCFYFGHSAGISYIDPTDGEIKDLDNLNPALNSKEWRIVQLFEDSRGLLWAATSKGLKVVDRNHGKITEVRTGEGKQNGYISGIIEDNGGSIWVSEGRTLSNLRIIYDDKTGTLDISPRGYDTEDGLMESDFNQRAFAKLHSGEILIGGLYGANRFSPSGIKYNTTIPRVVFTDLYVNGKEVVPGEKVDGTIVIERGVADGGKITVPHGMKDFTIYFTTDNYALPEKTTFTYCLEGFDKEWITLPPGQHSVTYTNLSAGTYRFLVRGINADGYESDQPGEIEIKVLPSFWTSWWAWAIYAVLLALIVWAVVKIISRMEKKRFQRKMEDEERKKQEEINQLKFQFFTNVSHDLRTPLTLIVSPLDEMIKETEDPRQKKRLKLLKENASRLLTLVNQLLDFRKNEVTGLKFNPVESDIVAFSKRVCDSFQSLAERKKVTLSFYADHNSIEMAFDQDKLEKILMNLLGNAFKFTPPFGRVDVSLEEVGAQKPVLRIKVADTGSGIRDKDKEHIFDTFYQADGDDSQQQQTGSGIGLSMVKEYVKLHQGSVRVTDNVTCGSVFIIDLPITHTDHKQPIQTEPAPILPPVVEEEEDSETIVESEAPAEATAEEEKLDKPGTDLPIALVVDDNPDMTEMLKFELEKDFMVLTAENGIQALEVMKSDRPAIILTDLMMPEMDGIELCRRLKSNPDTVNIPLIILTAKHDLGVKIEGLTIGADDYITKPFNLDVLRLRMKRLVGLTGKGATRALIEPEPEAIKITPLDEKFIEKAMKYVSDNIDSPRLSVEEMSDQLGMSRVRLYKKIKQITGKTPIEFIRVIRLKRAAQLLRESQLNVSEIAYRTGFNSPKVFSKYFKDEFGILPSAYQDKEGTETNYPV